MTRRLALMPSHPERICWGCDQHCPADQLTCGNGTERTPHPIELFGEDWLEWAQDHGGYEWLESAASRATPESAPGDSPPEDTEK
jgi:hypothetical protein